MILKIRLGKGGRGLLNYISQLFKAPVHHPQPLDPKNYALRFSDSDQSSRRRGQPATGLSSLPHLSFLNVVHHPRADHGRRTRESHGEVLLHADALHDLDRGAAADPVGMRRPGNLARPAAGGRERGLKQHAPPTFSTFAGQTPRAIAAEFGALRRLRPGLGKAVGHLILSPDPGDRPLSLDEWKTALSIALAAHGAADAPHAAWLHDDTDLPHLHCFFSRVLTNGEVVSDSQSYQKNRSASRKIERELNLNPLPPSSPDAPGDREAAQSASRRTERMNQSMPDSKLPDAKRIRELLAEAKDLEEFQRLLAQAGHETEFQRRGAGQEIYGWKVRVIGTDTWSKASTLGKDLSWPKIAHRFVADADQAQENPALPTPMTALQPPASRVPTMLVRVLPNSVPQSSNESRKNQVFGRQEAEEAHGRELSRLSSALLALGAALVEISAALAESVIAFLKALLARLGLALRPAQLQTYRHPIAGALTFEPVKAEALPGPVPMSSIDGVADVVEQVTAAVKLRSAAALPREAANEPQLARLLDAEGRSAAPVASASAPVAAGSATSDLKAALMVLELRAGAYRKKFFASRVAAAGAGVTPLLQKEHQEAQQRLLVQYTLIRKAVESRRSEVALHAPLREAAKALETSLGGLRDGIQLFISHPESKDKYFAAATPFLNAIEKFEETERRYPMPVAPVEDGGDEGGGGTGRVDMDWLDPDSPLKDGFDVPRG
ncbi:MAG: relaxase/mobilization nuclease domain-containing protein [Polaromonas sp.]|nr:relaxase/mobilization nuclease domain-containing protein [Polaromonas sp.]